MGKFKVGDRVRVVNHTNYNRVPIKMDLPIGSIHTIVENIYQIKDTNCWILSGSGNHFYVDHNLEPVAVAPQPDGALTITAGRYYKTRDGRRVGPVVLRDADNRDDTDGPYRIAGEWNYLENGLVGSISRGDHPADLIAEWVDEPAVALATEFKVGDRVEFIATTGSNGRLIGKRGVIAATYDDGYDWCIRLDEYNVSYGHGCDGVVVDGYGRYADSSDLRLVAPATSGKEEAVASAVEAYDEAAPTTIADIVRRLERRRNTT